MKYPGHIDRRKHEVDITERVLEGGVWAGPGHFDDTRIVNLNSGAQARPVGARASAVQMQTGRKHRDSRHKR